MLSARWDASRKHKRQHGVLKILRDLWRYRASHNRTHGSGHHPPSPSDIDEKPGYLTKKFAWLVLFAGFIVLTVLNGFVYSFAIILVDLMKEFQTGYASTSLVLGIQLFGFCFFGGIIGQATVKYGYQHVALSGAALSALSIYLSSFSTELWQVMITLGLCYGIGSGMIYYTTLGIVQAWFVGKKALATGVVVSGSGFGAMITPPFVEFMLTNFGWRIYLRVIAVIVGVTWIIGASIYIPPRYDKMSERKKEDVKGVMDFALLKDPVFILICFCQIPLSFAYHSPFAHIVAYAMEKGIPRASASRLIIYGGVSMFFGRIILGNIGDFVSVHYLFTLCFLITGCATAFAPLYSNEMMFAVYYSVYQFFAGAYPAMFPVVTAKSMGGGKFMQAYGLVASAGTGSALLSPFVTGWMKDVYGTYDQAFVVIGILFCICTVPIVIIPRVIAARGRKITFTKDSVAR